MSTHHRHLRYNSRSITKTVSVIPYGAFSILFEIFIPYIYIQKTNAWTAEKKMLDHQDLTILYLIYVWNFSSMFFVFRHFAISWYTSIISNSLFTYLFTIISVCYNCHLFKLERSKKEIARNMMLREIVL
jgi:hypothetical protein